MKKILFALFAMLSVISFYFFQPPSARADEIKTFVGIIQSVRIAPMQFRSGPPFWPFMKLEVAADNGEKLNFFICGPGQHTTTFYDINGNAIEQNSKAVGKGKKVEVKYTTPAEISRWQDKQLAISVRYVPAGYVSQPTAPSAQAGTNPTSSVTAVSEIKSFIGTVKDVTAVLGKEPNWTYNKIEVSADKGDKADFFVMRRTVITDSGGVDISGKRIQKGKKVEIKYSTLTDSSYIINGQKGADSILYLD